MQEEYDVVHGKKLRRGYTTGSTAAAAAAAAVEMLLSGQAVLHAGIRLPGGERAVFDIENIEITEGRVACSVTKDGGDDPDATTGLAIYAEASWRKSPGEQKIMLEAGEGVGRVTKPGLACAVGEPAINPVPRKMILENVGRILDSSRCETPVLIRISVPGGQEVAKKTFNPRLGILGGISILGTTGIVEPMSEKALIGSIHVEIDRCAAEDPERILIAPGNYGRTFCRETLGLDIGRSAQISNYVGESLDYIRYKGFSEVLLVGHAGKLVKIAAGVMNTHSSVADCRMEVIAAHAAALGASPRTVGELLECVTTEEAFRIVQEEEYYEALKRRILGRMLHHLRARLREEVRIEAVMFTSIGGEVIKSDGADRLIREIRQQQGVDSMT